MNRSFLDSPHVKRLVGCLVGAFVLALMLGKQEGNQDDYGFAFRQAILAPRIFVFIALGVLAWVVLTFWPRVVPYLQRPGVRPLAVGLLTVMISQTLLKWYDQAGDGKFGTVASQATNTPGLAPLANAFFGWLAWTLLIVVLLVAGAAIVLRQRILAWITAVLGLAGAFLAYSSHSAVVSIAGGIDHSLGSGVAVLGYLVIASAGAAIALADSDVADTRRFMHAVLSWRPGMVLVVLGLVTGIIAFAQATWFAPQSRNDTLLDAKDLFQGQGLADLAFQYLAWLGWALFFLTAVGAAAACYLRLRLVGWIAAGLGVVATLLTLITLYDMSDLAAQSNVDSATGPWQNLGSGGWVACFSFFALAGAGLVAATAGNRVTAHADGAHAALRGTSSDVLSSKLMSAPGAGKTLLFAAVAFALFYPPTATSFWQQVLVSEIGIYVLLAIGLNVVVGWAGLLDLGFIAFYAIGSYTTAYLVGSLPIKPPSWLHMSPLLAIPFAIAICLFAGVTLGAPTLRLRGDYLAIVTLGFGEIIRIIAINADGVTNSTRGPSPQVPHPVIHLGPIKFTWGLNQLQYWYLLLVLILIVVILFTRLEGSRLGRAWAAIREDEVAAQATGINTTRVKLLAFAIGASTSGVAGVFFASQVGYFNPDNFVLNNSILVVAYVVFGGMGSLPGAMAGAAVLTWLPEFLKDQVPAEDRQMWIGAVVLLMMIFRPAGLIPARRRAAELSGLHRTSSAEVGAVPEGEGMGVRA
jgi:ABC-type branched-subunit amino acid transport system permease subunit